MKADKLKFKEFSKSCLIQILHFYKGLDTYEIRGDDNNLMIVALDKDGNRYAILMKSSNLLNYKRKQLKLSNNDIFAVSQFARHVRAVPLIAFVTLDNLEDIQKLRIFLISLNKLSFIVRDENKQYIKYSDKQSVYILDYQNNTKKKYLQSIINDVNIDYNEIALDKISCTINI